MKTLVINKHLELKDIDFFLKENPEIIISSEAVSRIKTCREWLDNFLEINDTPVYGINTGFGSLCNIKIDKQNLEKLQENLILSHACGCGELVPKDIVRLMLLLKIQNLSFGNSAVQNETVQRLADMLNHDIIPLVYEFGSVGASGDLAPLAHLSLPLIGHGEVYYKGEVTDAKKAFKDAGLQIVRLKSKEGLALLNGTQFMLSYSMYVLTKALKLMDWADFIASCSLEGFYGLSIPFHPLIHQVRPHQGQTKTAQHLLSYLAKSEIQSVTKEYVQDPYSFRCIPQVHGASRDAIEYCSKVFQTETGSVTDNPTIFPDENIVISGGNFHGQPLALALDFFNIAIAELASISERRTFRLLSGKRGLPDLLVARPGLNSGLMIPQYTAASIVSHNKSLCHPSSVDSIETCQGQEDHVSMGASAAIKSLKVLTNLQKVLAIELLCAAQALDFRKPVRSSPLIESVIAKYRKSVPFVEDDTYMHTLIDNSEKFITEHEITDFVKKLSDSQ